MVWQTLVRGTRDYLRKNGFQTALLGLSGGIDSALTLAIAVDAVGKDRVRAVMMPSRHTSDLSIELARTQADVMGVQHDQISIEQPFKAMLESLAPLFADRPADVTEENLQARVRGNLLMALSNKLGCMLLSTGNKSETAVGYCTIYGDMCGGFAPIKDCPKTLVYELARYCNRNGEIIPQGVIDRPPTAELAPGQVDQDSLPPYEELDEIIARYVERDESVSEIIAAGFSSNTVLKIARLVRINEYKRRQAAPGVRVTSRAFGRDRRYPITNLYEDTSPEDR
jgi:NAD+ synthase (glutamine-hydrolysing)